MKENEERERERARERERGREREMKIVYRAVAEKTGTPLAGSS